MTTIKESLERFVIEEDLGNGTYRKTSLMEYVDRYCAEQLDPIRLAAALERIGAPAIEDMAWTPYRIPPEYVGDPDDNVLADEPYRMASLAAAIIEALGSPD